MAAALASCTKAYEAHLKTICEFSLNRPPMRAKVDRQSYDELKPGVDKALALLDWYEELKKAFVACLRELGSSSGGAKAEGLAALVEALDCCVVLENQFSGWSQCINRFSWFKRTFAQIRREVSAEIDCDKLSKDISRFGGLIGTPRESTHAHNRHTATPLLIVPSSSHFLRAPHPAWPLSRRAAQATPTSRSACTSPARCEPR